MVRKDDLCDLSSKSPSVQFKHEKTPDKFQLRNIWKNTWPALSRTFKVIKSEISLRSCHSQEEPKETYIHICQRINIYMQTVSILWMGGWTRKGHHVKTKKTQSLHFSEYSHINTGSWIVTNRPSFYEMLPVGETGCRAYDNCVLSM